MIDPILSLAFSVHSNQGIYALLLGSGVSRAAGIPTGWEVVLDLIRKLAHLRGENCEPDPAAWYRSEYQEEPDYAKLLDAIAKSPSERSQLLKGYFEPTEDEREQGLKLPTAAHKAIANLVANGYIRVILTTNFDRLLEKALEAVGVVPTVISTADAVDGAMPLVHTKCSIIKIHGDYLDTRIKNTPAELEQYDGRFNCLLDRVFDEFGLIVCGWSGEWDTALRAAIERCPSRRFTTFWAARGEPRGAAKNLLGRRSGVFVTIQNAESFFQELAEKVSALQEINSSHPLSTKVAVASLKKYLVDARYRIRLHDLVSQEVEKLYTDLSSEHSSLGSSFSAEELVRRVRRYESLTEILLAIVTNGCYWGEQSHEYLWVDSLERIANQPELRSGLSYLKVWRQLSFYPALLLLYAGGITSLASGQYSTFAALLLKPQVKDFSKSQPLVLSLNTRTVMEKNVGQQLPGMETRYTPLSDHLYEVLREPLKEFLPQDVRYQKCFDRFEYLFSLVHIDFNLRQGYGDWGAVGSFGWRRDIISEIKLEFKKAGRNWAPLKAGLFDGSVERFQSIEAALDEQVGKLGWEW